MAKQRFRGILNVGTFPLVSVLQGRTVVQPQLDLNTPRRVAGLSIDESKESTIPQLLYCENVIPTEEGLQSCTFIQKLNPIIGNTDFDSFITLRNDQEQTFSYCPAAGANYIYNAISSTWNSINPISGASGITVTRAFVNGRTFICYSGLGVYEFDDVANTFNHLTLIGLLDADVMGIGSSSNYLLAYDNITVFWSSLINPLDFVPSLITGAGFAVPQDVRGNITAILGTNGGFIIYTALNAVAAVFSNNTRAPFNFKEIANAGGIRSYEQVTSEQSSGIQYAWTSNGAQKITLQSSEPISGAVNDFFAGRQYETYDRITKRLLLQFTSSPEFRIKAAYIAGRYLVFSYSVDTSSIFQYALIYDTTLKRWGKVKFDHVDCFSFRGNSLVGNITYDMLASTAYDDLSATTYDDLSTGTVAPLASKRSIGFLKADGSAYILVSDYNKEKAEDGVVIFGKFQLLRARMIGLQTFDLEGVYADSVSGTPLVTVTAMASLDGANMDTIIPMMLIKASRLLQVWARKVVGLNVSVAVEGTFALSSYLVECTLEGDR